MKTIVTLASAAVLGLGLIGTAQAAPLNGTGDLTANVVMGSGIGDGGWTGVTVGGLELALRAKVRFNAAGLPENTFNYDGVDTYTFDNMGNPAHRSVFNFEFAINTDIFDTTDSPTATVNDYDYLLEVDTDPTVNTSFISFDAVQVLLDNSFGFNSTSESGGVEGPASSLGDDYNIVQQSHNLGFGYSSDPDGEGKYTFRLSVFDGQSLVGSTEIHAIVGTVPPIPLPATMPLLLAGLGGLVALRRRKRA